MLRLLRSSAMLPPRQAAAAAAAAATCRHRFMSTAILPSVDSLRPLPPTDDGRAILQDRLGYTFRRPELLQHALTHPSHPYGDQHSLMYDLFKGIGERILVKRLELYSSQYQCLVGLNMTPNKLARSAIRLGLYSFLCHNQPNLDQEVKEFTDEQLGRVLYRGIPSNAPTILADLVQVIIGAVMVDLQFEESDAWEATSKHVKPIFFRGDVQHRHIVTTLECICRDYRMSFDFKSTREDTVYTTHVFINNILHGSGSYTVESHAKGIATLDALNNLPMYMLTGTRFDTPFKMKQKLRSSLFNQGPLA